MSETNRPVGLEQSSPVFPWYKKRLRTKCLKDLKKKQQLSGALDARRWRFLKPGQDDFRDGYPALQGEFFTQPQTGTAPPVMGLKDQARPSVSPKKRFTKEQACFSKMPYLHRRRLHYVEAVEQKLKDQILAQRIHFTSSLTPEMFNDVLSVLGLELQIERESYPASSAQEEECSEEKMETLEGTTEKPSTKENTISMKDGVKASSSGNPYKWQEAKDTRAKEDQMASDEFLHSPSQDEDIKELTKRFSDWVTSLGSETSNLTESTIPSLFCSDIEKKPKSPFPVRVCRNSLCSAQLKNKVYTPPRKSTNGAWNLDPSTCKEQPADEPLGDPSMSKKQPLTEKDKKLMQLYVTQTFWEFVIRKRQRMPKSLQILKPLVLEEEQENRTRGTDRTASTSTRKGTAIL